MSEASVPGASRAGAPQIGSVSALPPEPPFVVDVPGFHGSLEELLLQAQRGEIDVAAIPLAEITAAFRIRVGTGATDSRAVADFLASASRLLALKAARLLPDGPLDAEVDAGMEVDESDPSDPGRRLAEYRLFRAAADALLAEAADEGIRSFLGIVAAEVVPAERLSIPPERLAAAFRAILERLPAPEALRVEAVTFSVEEKVALLLALLNARPRIAFAEVFAAVRSRLEAVACFLALLELVKRGAAAVEQAGAFDGIDVVLIAPRRP